MPWSKPISINNKEPLPANQLVPPIACNLHDNGSCIQQPFIFYFKPPLRTKVPIDPMLFIYLSVVGTVTITMHTVKLIYRTNPLGVQGLDHIQVSYPIPFMVFTLNHQSNTKDLINQLAFLQKRRRGFKLGFTFED